MSKNNVKIDPSLEQKIKEMEWAARKEIKISEDHKISFDEWHSIRSSAIPGHHLKEILKVDFKARGVEERASMEAFDEALAKYGIKLN